MLRLRRGLLVATACCRSSPTAQRWLCVVWGSVGWYGVVWGTPSLLQAPGSCILEWDDRDFARKSSESCFKKKTNLKHQWCHPGALDGVSRVTAPHIPVMLHGARLTRTPLAWLQLARESIKM